ncbi:MAG: hypothetical protein ACREAA_00515 [Candidatus Polarisedimenticolia bacterium]
MPRQHSVLARELATIGDSFTRLALSFERITPLMVNGAGGHHGAVLVRTARRKPRLTARRRAALKLQGKYMGMMRGMRPAGRARIKKIRAMRGIEAAIAAAERLSSES